MEFISCFPGHLRPLSALACKIVKERPDVAVTLLTFGDFTGWLEQELGRFFTDGDVNSRESIR